MSATSLPATAIFSHQAATLDENFSNSTRVAVSSDNATAKPFLALASCAAASDRTRLATDQLQSYEHFRWLFVSKLTVVCR